MTMLAVKNFFLPERKAPPETPKFSRMPEAFLRSIRRRSLRIKRPKTVIVEREKRKSDGMHMFRRCVVVVVVDVGLGSGRNAPRETRLLVVGNDDYDVGGIIKGVMQCWDVVGLMVRRKE
uniref:Uncharacterized protein n=1 Tax=Anopheles farauti TaxID=69004 RepID=A0A182QR88_9DIPT